MLSFERTRIAGVWRITTKAHEDDRGAFARLYCPVAFKEAGIAFTSAQINLSTNDKRHTLRGMHWQNAPNAEAKLVRVISGSIYDVVADLRVDSATRGAWEGFELSASDRTALFIPEGCAHGFLTLEDDTAILYQMGRNYVPNQAKGFRFDDPAFSITWPAMPRVIAEGDLAWPALSLG
jgi:dTDP-4-dehydrorhamnose 3,5-epimerase